MTLVEQLMKEHSNLTEARAKTVAGFCLLRVKRRVNAEDFAKIKAIVPDTVKLIKCASTADVPIQSTFAYAFYPTVLSFIESKGGEELKDIFNEAIFKA